MSNFSQTGVMLQDIFTRKYSPTPEKHSVENMRELNQVTRLMFRFKLRLLATPRDSARDTREVPITVAPAAAKRLAAARPMPVDAPVMRMIFPVRSCMTSHLHSGDGTCRKTTSMTRALEKGKHYCIYIALLPLAPLSGFR